MRMYFTYLLFSLLSASVVLGQSPEEAAKSKYIGSIAFQSLSGGVIMVSGRIDGWQDSLHFLLDTGSGGISLDSSKSVSIGFTPSENIRLSGIGGSRESSVSNNHTLHLNGISTSNLDFHLYDYRLLSSIYGVQIDGVIGYAFFSRYIVILDHETNTMSLFSKGEFTYPKKGVSFDVGKNLIPEYPLTTSEKSTEKHLFFLDTGAGLSLLLNSEYAKDAALFPQQKKFFTTRAEGVGGKKRMQLTTLKKVSIGPFVFRNVPTYVFNDELGVTGYPRHGGLLGNEILRRFNVILNYMDGTMHLKPNIHLNDPFEYGYSGFSMLLNEEDLMVEDVIADSPAFKAGLRSGDVIIGINGDFSGNIQTYRAIIQEPDKEVKMLIRRNEDLIDISFFPVSIL